MSQPSAYNSGNYPGYPPNQECPPGTGYPQFQHVYPPAPPPVGGNYYPPPYPQPQGYPPPTTQIENYGPQLPITNQPLAGAVRMHGHFGPADGWMGRPQQVPANCPPGLEYLTTIDQLFVKQKVELLEVFIGWETGNKYTIKNNQGQKVFYAVEESNCCSRQCCGSLRSFNLRILDNAKNEVIRVEREFACDTCWFPCCLQTMQVYAPSGNLIGSVEQTWSVFTPEFDVKNERGDVVLTIDGPMCRYSICGDVEFKILSKDRTTVVGKISKQWSGLVREAFTDADCFGISFPLDLDVRMKAVMLGACFLIDFMFFEKSGNEENDCMGMC